MHLGSRRIRSAGHSSGSIEITLPAQLQALEGVHCHLMVRDGPRPELVFQPDLAAAQALFREFWHKLSLGLGEIGDLGDFSSGDFTLALFPPSHWQDRPPLAYIDALAVLSRKSGRSASNPEALARLLTYLAIAAGYRLGLGKELALAFGDAVAYLITGISIDLGTDFERGMAYRLFWGEGRAAEPLGSAFDERTWQRAQPGLRQVYDQLLRWQDNREAYISSRRNWYRALAVELGAPA